MSNILSTDQLENISNDITTSTNTTPPKRGRGRPAKYAKEEREEKYKENTKKWVTKHKEYYKDSRKQYYVMNSNDIQQNKKEYYERSSYALRLLNDIWKSPELVEFKSDDLKYKIQNLIENKRIIIS